MVLVKAATGGIFKFFSISFLLLFLIIELVQIIYLGVTTHSVQPILTELGGKFIFTTQQLGEASRQIIDQGGVQMGTVDLTQNPISGVWGIIKNFSFFFTSFYTIFLWIAILNWIFAHTIFHNEAKSFFSVILAIFVFMFLQSALIMSNAAIAHNVDCFSGCGEKSVISYITTPFTCFKDFFQAIGVIINSVKTPQV